MSNSEIGGLKASASDGSEGSSRERSLARSLSSSFYIYIYIFKPLLSSVYIFQKGSLGHSLKGIIGALYIGPLYIEPLFTYIYI